MKKSESIGSIGSIELDMIDPLKTGNRLSHGFVCPVVRELLRESSREERIQFLASFLGTFAGMMAGAVGVKDADDLLVVTRGILAKVEEEGAPAPGVH